MKIFLKSYWPNRDECPIIGGPCYIRDAAYQAAEELAPRFVDLGEQVIWDKLEELYEEIR